MRGAQRALSRLMFPLDQDCGHYDLRDYQQKCPGGVRLVRRRQNEVSTSNQGLLDHVGRKRTDRPKSIGDDHYPLH